MSRRSILYVAAAGSLWLAPGTALAQAPWTPPKGEVSVAVTYQWLDSDRHLFSRLDGPELTPFEVARRTDYQTNSLDFGRVQSHATVIEAEAGINDRFAIAGTLTAVAPRYRGAFAHPGTADNGAFHATVQDLQVGGRYMFERGEWALTPHVSATLPMRDYEVLAHAAQGLGLKMLEGGASLGRLLTAGGAARGYVQATYGYSLVERAVQDVSLNRSRAALEGGYFFSRFTVQAMTTWRHVHGGLDWADVSFLASEHFETHDQSAATREWRYGLGVSIQVTNRASLELSYGDFIKGANTHDARTFALGWTWGFQAFGTPTVGEGFR
jgi:hypothetical protein